MSRLASQVVLALLLPCLAVAAEMKTRVQFAPGKSSGTYKGTVTSKDKVVYVLRCTRSQTLTAKVTGSTENNDVVFSIKSPSGKSIMGEEGDDYGTEWSGWLHESGDYRVELGLIESERSRYVLEVGVK
jgi:hypothetical protein